VNGFAYLLDIRQFNASNIEFASALVTSERRIKADVYLERSERWASIGVGLLLQYVLKTHYQDHLLVSYSETGKPKIIGQKGVYISLSHSGNYCACAVSEAPIGIDIQEHTGDYPLIIKHFFRDDEKRYLASFLEADREEHFYRLWCRKEAELKAIGAHSIRQTNAVFAPDGWVFRDFLFDGTFCAIYGKCGYCPAEAPILSVDFTIDSLNSKFGWQGSVSP